MSVMNKEQIMEIIPHRDPFMLIDSIEEIEYGKRVVAKKYMSPDEFWFKGHFPDYPVVPGVLMLEMCAQAGAVALLGLPENKGEMGLCEVEINKVKGPVGVGKCIATVNGEKAVSAEISFAIK